MPAYVIYQGEVLDPERYEQYKTASTNSTTPSTEIALKLIQQLYPE